MAKNDDSVWRKMMARLNKLKREPHVKVGIFGDATKAASHEYGAPGAGIPERSFIRLTFNKNEAELKAMTAKVTTQLVLGKMDVNKSLDVLGLWGASEVKKTIREQPSEWPPLSPAYAARKGANKNQILVDTGEMINSITHKVSADGTD